MANFLLVYDRDAGQLVRKQRYRTSSEAMQARFAAEDEFSGCHEIEIVAIAAESESAMKLTHGRYFFSLAELAAQLARSVEAGPQRLIRADEIVAAFSDAPPIDLVRFRREVDAPMDAAVSRPRPRPA